MRSNPFDGPPVINTVSTLISLTGLSERFKATGNLRQRPKNVPGNFYNLIVKEVFKSPIPY